MKKTHRFHFNEFVRSLILLGFAIFLFNLIHSGELTLYVHPRFTDAIELTICLLVLMFIVQITKTFNATVSSHGCCHHHGGIGSCLPFIMVLLMAILIPSAYLDVSLIASRGLNSQLDAPNPAAVIGSKVRPLSAQLSKMNAIAVTDHDFTDIMPEINLYTKDYLGKEIVMTGFVYKFPGHKPNEFALVRYVITCCTADALPYGVLVENKDAEQYQMGQWVEVPGVLEKGDYDGSPIAEIRATSVKKILQPQEPYVFPETTI